MLWYCKVKEKACEFRMKNIGWSKWPKQMYGVHNSKLWPAIFFSCMASMFTDQNQNVQCFWPLVSIMLTFRLFATRMSQLKIWHFWVIGTERNVCRCTFIRHSVITLFAKLAAGEQLCRRCTHRKLAYSTSKLLNVSPEKSQILSCDTVVANERFM